MCRRDIAEMIEQIRNGKRMKLKKDFQRSVAILVSEILDLVSPKYFGMT